MSVLDVFSIVFESEGADKVKQDTQSLKNDLSGLSDTTEKVAQSEDKLSTATEKTAETIENAKKSIEELRAEQERLQASIADTEEQIANSAQGSDKYKALTRQLKDEKSQLKSVTKGLAEAQKAEKLQMAEMAVNTAKLIGAFVAVKQVIGGVFNVIKQGEDLYLMAKGAGVAVEKVQQLGLALENYGGSASSASAVLKKLNKDIQDLRFGKGGALGETAMLYGLDLGARNAEQLLENIARRMETLSETQKIDFASRLGLDNATMMLVSGGVKKFREEMERAKKAVPFTNADIESSRKLSVQLRELGQQWEKIRVNLLLGLMPVVRWLAKGFNEIIHIFQEHKGFIFGFLGTVIALFGKLIAKQLLTLATNPFVLMVAAIMAVGTAIGLIVDDVVTFFEGGISYTGEYVAKLKDLWNTFAEWFKAFWDGFTDVFAVGFGYLFEVPEKLKGLWTDIINGWKIILQTFFDWLSEKFSFIGKVADFVGGFFSGDSSITAQPAVLSVALPQMQMTQTPLNSMTSTQMSMMNANTYYDQNSNSSQSVNVSGVTINTQATNAKELAKDFKQSLISEFQGVAWQNGSGEL